MATDVKMHAIRMADFRAGLANPHTSFVENGFCAPQAAIMQNLIPRRDGSVARRPAFATKIHSTSPSVENYLKKQTAIAATDFYAVSCISATVAWACAANGKLYKTTTAGGSWGAAVTPPSAASAVISLTGVFFLNATNGWCCGVYSAGGAPYIAWTTDAGVTWTEATGYPAGADWVQATVNAIHFASATVGWVVAEQGEVATTADGGATWTAQTTAALSLHSVYAHSTTRINIAGTGGVSLSTDGGATWGAFAAVGNVQDLDFSGATGWLVGAAGLIQKSTDTGGTWVAQTGGSGTINGVYAASASIVFAVGTSVAFQTANGGTTWSALAVASPGTFNDIDGFSATQAIAVGVSGACRTLAQATAAYACWGAYYNLSNTSWYISCTDGRLYKVNAGGTWTLLSVGGVTPGNFLIWWTYIVYHDGNDRLIITPAATDTVVHEGALAGGTFRSAFYLRPSMVELGLDNYVEINNGTAQFPIYPNSANSLKQLRGGLYSGKSTPELYYRGMGFFGDDAGSTHAVIDSSGAGTAVGDFRFYRCEDNLGEILPGCWQSTPGGDFFATKDDIRIMGWPSGPSRKASERFDRGLGLPGGNFQTDQEWLAQSSQNAARTEYYLAYPEESLSGTPPAHAWRIIAVNWAYQNAYYEILVSGYAGGWIGNKGRSVVVALPDGLYLLGDSLGADPATMTVDYQTGWIEIPGSRDAVIDIRRVCIAGKGWTTARIDWEGDNNGVAASGNQSNTAGISGKVNPAWNPEGPINCKRFQLRLTGTVLTSESTKEINLREITVYYTVQRDGRP